MNYMTLTQKNIGASKMRDLTKVIKWLSTREAKYMAYKEVYKARENPPKKGGFNNAIKN